jgi:hypothetical protein
VQVVSRDAVAARIGSVSGDCLRSDMTAPHGAAANHIVTIDQTEVVADYHKKFLGA